MKYLYRSISTFTLNGMEAILRVKTDGNQLYLNVSPAEPGSTPSGSLSLTAEYGGVTRVLSSDPFRETEAVFPYDDGVKSVTLSGMTVNDCETAQSVFSWIGSVNDPDPEVTITCSGVRSGSLCSFSWQISDAAGRVVYPFFISLEYWSSVEEYDHQVNFTNAPEEELFYGLYHYISSSVLPGTRIRLKFCCAAYRRPNAGDEEYTGLQEVYSPFYTVTEADTPYAPYDLTCKRPVLGASLRLSWHSVQVDRQIRYELQRSVNGGDFIMVYQGSSSAFTDQMGRDWDTVVYRVRTLNAGKSSVFHYGDTLIPLRSNIYVGHGGQVRPAEGMRLGLRNGTAELVPLISVGR